jgi:hypothetical protein
VNKAAVPMIMVIPVEELPTPGASRFDVPKPAGDIGLVV